MKHPFLTTCLGVSLALATVVKAEAATIDDNYIGSLDHGYGDVIGYTSLFDTDHVDISLNNSTLVVDLFTNFAGHADDGLYARYTRGGTGIGYGDLFLSSAWDPYGSAPYLSDNASNGTRWEYAISLDNRWSASGGTGTLYALPGGYTSGGGGFEDVLTSNYFMTGAIFRDNQEVAVNTRSANLSALTTGSWTVYNGFLRFEMDVSGTSLLGGDLSVHWGPTCANDVIEGFASVGVPEPAALFLMLTGFVGLVGSRMLKPKA